MGYEPLDIAHSATTPVDSVAPGARPGDAVFHGLPFVVGERAIAPGGDDGVIDVPVGRDVTHVVFAHRLLDSDLEAGGELGVVAAEYVFEFQDGSVDRAEVRERFEISAIPTPWGQMPFLAVADYPNRMDHRPAGPWGQAGGRQTEANQAWARWWYLWAWESPAPGRRLERIRIEPRGPRFAIGAITTSDLPEFPFNRQARREVIVEPLDAGEGRIRVDVDRGWANYAHPLPSGTAADFLADPLRGFGEPDAPEGGPSFVEIGAVPSAAVRVRRGDDELGTINWGDLESAGEAIGGRVRARIVDRGRNWVHVTVTDDDTGRPVPCKVHFRSPEGVAYQPHGHHHQVNSHLPTWHVDVGGDVRLGRITYAYIDGTCQGFLPRGEVLVDVARGYEYEPVRQRMTIAPGQRELSIRLKRWTDMNAQGWYSGDTHVHFLSQQGAHLEGRGEDLDVVNLLQSQWGALFTNTEEFTGGPSVAPDGQSIVYVTQENRQHILGHLTLLGLKSPVMPWCTDGPSEAEMGSALDATMSDWADRCHEQGGWVVIPHLPNPNGEPATLIATGRADAIEWLEDRGYGHIEYYRYLNGGYRLPLCGGTDKMTSDVPVGMYRTYARLDGEFTYENWCRAVASGRTFLSGGPMIGLEVDGAAIGDTLRIRGAGTVEVRAWAEGIFPVTRLEVVIGGRVVAAAESDGTSRRLELSERIRVDGHAWIAARCNGPDAPLRHLDGWRRGVVAHTSPVYVACGEDEWALFDASTARYMLTLVEGSLSYMDRIAPRWRQGSVTHHHGEADHDAWLRRPFLEARDAVEKRLAEHGLL